MAREWDIPKRYLKLHLYDGRLGGLESTTDLSLLDDTARVSFQLQASTALMCPTATVNIGGLLRDKMGYLATSYTPWLKNTIYNRIVIDAGYNNQHGVIFDGQIIEAQPNLESADFNINLKCQALSVYLDKKVTSLTFEGETSVKDIAEKIAESMDLKLVYYPDKDYKVTDYNMSDTDPVNQMRNLARASGLDIYTSPERMYVKEPLKEANLPVLKIDSSNIVGAPMPDSLGCRVQIRMNPNLVGGMPVSLNSERFPMLNTVDYHLQSFSHAGETKGRKWISELVLVRNKTWLG